MILRSSLASYGNTSALQKRGLKSSGKLSPAIIKGRQQGLESPIFDTKNSTKEQRGGCSKENYPVQLKSRKKMPLVGAPDCAVGTMMLFIVDREVLLRSELLEQNA